MITVGRVLADLASVLRAGEAWFHAAHHAVSGTSAPADHAVLYDEIYDLLDDEFDAVLERAIGLSDDPGLADPIELIRSASALLMDWPRPIGTGAEIAMRAVRVNQLVAVAVEGTIARIKELGAMTSGVDALLSQIVDAHERTGYKLGRRAGRPAVGQQGYTVNSPDAGPYIELPEDYGQSVYDGTVMKAAGHKYIKRVPYTGKDGKQRYRYFYHVGHGGTVGHADHIVAGASFRHGDGHYHVTSKTGDSVTVRHDETGETETLTVAALRSRLMAHHDKAIGEYRKRVEAMVAEAKPGSHAERRWMDVAAKVGAKPAAKPAAPEKAPEKAPAASMTTEDVIALFVQVADLRQEGADLATKYREKKISDAEFRSAYALLRQKKDAVERVSAGITPEQKRAAVEEMTRRQADLFRRQNELDRKARMAEQEAAARKQAEPEPKKRRGGKSKPGGMERRPDTFVRHGKLIDDLEAAHPGVSAKIEDGLRYDYFSPAKTRWMDEDLGLPVGTVEAVLAASKKWSRDGRDGTYAPYDRDDNAARERTIALAPASNASEFGEANSKWLRDRLGLPPEGGSVVTRKGFVIAVPRPAVRGFQP